VAPIEGRNRLKILKDEAKSQATWSVSEISEFEAGIRSLFSSNLSMCFDIIYERSRKFLVNELVRLG